MSPSISPTRTICSLPPVSGKTESLDAQIWRTHRKRRDSHKNRSANLSTFRRIVTSSIVTAMLFKSGITTQAFTAERTPIHFRYVESSSSQSLSAVFSPYFSTLLKSSPSLLTRCARRTGSHHLHKYIAFTTHLRMSMNGGNDNGKNRRTSKSNSSFSSSDNDKSAGKRSKSRRKSQQQQHRNGFDRQYQTTTKDQDEEKKEQEQKDKEEQEEYRLKQEIAQEKMLNRITQLESIVSHQAVEIRKLREQCNEIKDAAAAFSQVVNLLRQSGLSDVMESEDRRDEGSLGRDDSRNISDSKKPDLENTNNKTGNSVDKTTSNHLKDNSSAVDSAMKPSNKKEFEYFDDSEIFGSAPASVTDAADAAGASILAATLAGKQRMLVDVRDAELSRDPDVLVQFIELAILPVAAGLEGLKSDRNRVKIIFPTVSQLSQYRKTMTLAAPEVVALSTLGFDPVEKNDNLVVILAPQPDDEEGLEQMNRLLLSSSIRSPVVLINYHMVPLQGPGAEFDPVYHLRLLSVQYMTGNSPPEGWDGKSGLVGPVSDDEDKEEEEHFSQLPPLSSASESEQSSVTAERDVSDSQAEVPEKEDAALEAAMEHAHELGVHQGVTRAMVIRAYPKPWHVFVDTSPDTDADFEVAATFDEVPTQDDINYAIVECLEGSEREDELVAQQMQQALDAGQLNKVSEMLGIQRPNIEIDMNIGIGGEIDDDSEENDDEDFYNDWDPWDTDTV